MDAGDLFALLKNRHVILIIVEFGNGSAHFLIQCKGSITIAHWNRQAIIRFARIITGRDGSIFLVFIGKVTGRLICGSILICWVAGCGGHLGGIR